MQYLGLNFESVLNETEQQFIKYLVDNDFEIISHKQYARKTKIVVNKNDIVMKYDIEKDTNDIDRIKKQFNMYWNKYDRTN